MHSGLIRLSDLERLQADDLYRQLRQFADAFAQRHSEALAHHRRRWSAANPLDAWSRRWEYPYVAHRIARALTLHDGADRAILDAGSGVTFFPWWLAAQDSDLQVTCCDIDAACGPAFEAINRASRTDVQFVPASLQQLPMDDASFDAIYCISVLEHTGDFAAVLDEFDRVLRPGGTLVVTFDISLDRKTDVAPEEARRLLEQLAERFDVEEGFDPLAELAALEAPAGLLTTDHIRHHDRARLPWPHPILKSLYDLLHGRGWTGGFFSLACYCIAARKRGHG